MNSAKNSANGHNFAGLRIIGFENRHSVDMRSLIEHYKGVPSVVPTIREVSLGFSSALGDFQSALLNNQIDVIIFLTGAGTYLLSAELEKNISRPKWVEAVKQTTVIARGPKPSSVLRDLGIAVSFRVSAPYTWREVLFTLDANRSLVPLKQRVVAIQEYGMMNRNLIKGLKMRGAAVMRVPLYKWALPENLSPLRTAVENIADGRFDVALFTSGTQVWHLFKVAIKKGMEEELRAGLKRMVVASIGPSTSEALAEFAIAADLVPPQAKMGNLIKFAALHSHTILVAKQSFAK